MATCGRATCSSTAGVVLIDPAAHGGHGLTDLAMLHLFGAPQLEAITSAYAEAADLPEGWADLIGLHQLHPLLVHAVSHGPSYGAEAKRGRRALHLKGCDRGRRQPSTMSVGISPGRRKPANRRASPTTASASCALNRGSASTWRTVRSAEDSSRQLARKTPSTNGADPRPSPGGSGTVRPRRG